MQDKMQTPTKVFDLREVFFPAESYQNVHRGRKSWLFAAAILGHEGNQNCTADCCMDPALTAVPASINGCAAV